MRQAVVKANLGFVSEKMPMHRAVFWAMQLRELGNVDVEVIPV